MAVIGVDTSGKINQPPIIVVAVKNGNICVVKFTREKINELKRLRFKHELLFALIVSFAINKFLNKGDIVEIDREYPEKTLNKIRAHLSNILKLPQEQIRFSSRRISTYIKKAHILTQLAKEGKIEINTINPKIEI